jgi:hypothetical protein
MRKLLLSTAIASATLFASNAIAQTTVSGSLDIIYKAFSDEVDGALSYNGFGKEAQINIQNKGKLNNGMEYAAGFSLEDDGNQAGTYFNENTYINFISGNTTLHIGQDHIQNNDRTLATFQGLIAEDLVNTFHSGAAQAEIADIFIADVGGNPAASYGVGLIQTIPGFGNLSALYVPSNSGATVFGGDDAGSDDIAESAYEIGFVGGLGVKGLSTHAFYAKGQKAQISTSAATDVDPKGHNIGISYNMGATTVGYNYKKQTPQVNTSAKRDTKQNEFGISYAVSPNLTLAANYTKAEKDGTDTPADAKAKSISVGYSLGAIALTAQAAKLEDFDGTAGTDADVLFLRASTKF